MQMLIKIVLFCFSFVACGYNIQQVKTLKEKLAAGAFVNASGCDFRGLGTLFQGLNLSGTQLSGALFGSVSQDPIVQSGLQQTAGQISDVSNLNFSNATLVSASFKNALLNNANFAGADLSYVDFTGANLTGVNLDVASNTNGAFFCNTIMPDGKRHSGKTWTSPGGKVYQLQSSGQA